MTLPPDVRSAYDAAAAAYDDFVPGLSGELPLHLALLGGFAELVCAGGSRTVLDAGCGTGRLVPFLRQAGLQPVGIDASAGMVAAARAANRHEAFAVSDLAALPFADDCFGGVLAWYSLIHTAPESLGTTLAEIARVLRPGGPFLTGFQVGSGTRTATGYYLGESAITAYLFTADQVADELGELGFEVLATCTTAPAGAKRPQGFVLARRAD